MKSENLKLIFRGGYRAEYIASQKNPQEPNGFPIEEAITIIAQVSHGLANFGSNVVIEVYEIE